MNSVVRFWNAGSDLIQSVILMAWILPLCGRKRPCLLVSWKQNILQEKKQVLWWIRCLWSNWTSKLLSQTSRLQIEAATSFRYHIIQRRHKLCCTACWFLIDMVRQHLKCSNKSGADLGFLLKGGVILNLLKKCW